MERKEQLTKQTEQDTKKVSDKALSRSVTVSLLSIFICGMCLVGLTWAWFSDGTASQSNRIQAANFDLTVTVTEASASDALTPDTNGRYALNAGTSYTVKLQADSERLHTTAAEGFYRITLKKTGDDAASVFYTEKFGKNTVFTFNLTGFESVSLMPMWGELPAAVIPTQLVTSGGHLPALMQAITPLPETESTEASEVNETEPSETTATEGNSEP